MKISYSDTQSLNAHTSHADSCYIAASAVQLLRRLGGLLGAPPPITYYHSSDTVLVLTGTSEIPVLVIKTCASSKDVLSYQKNLNESLPHRSINEVKCPNSFAFFFPFSTTSPTHSARTWYLVRRDRSCASSVSPRNEALAHSRGRVGEVEDTKRFPFPSPVRVRRRRSRNGQGTDAPHRQYVNHSPEALRVRFLTRFERCLLSCGFMRYISRERLCGTDALVGAHSSTVRGFLSFRQSRFYSFFLLWELSEGAFPSRTPKWG